MLADVQVAHRYLLIFSQPDISFEKILDHIHLCSESGKISKLQAIETSMENLNEIKVRFTLSEGVRGIIPVILDFMDRGWYVFKN